MNRVNEADFPGIKRGNYDIISKFPIINAVISNEQHGFVYSDNNRENTFICSKFGWSLFLNEDSTKIDKCFEFLRTNSEIPDYIHLYPPNSAFINYVKINWPKFKTRERCQLRYLKRLKTDNCEIKLLSGFSLINIQDINFSKLDAFKLDLDNRYWHSKDDFMRNAIGACIVNSENEPVAICYSVCIVDSIAEVDILVLPEFRNFFFGRIVSEAFLKLTIEKGVIAHWDTFTSNTPSLQLAIKSGYKRINVYELISVFLRDW
jgi:hypothetical protein